MYHANKVVSKELVNNYNYSNQTMHINYYSNIQMTLYSGHCQP